VKPKNQPPPSRDGVNRNMLHMLMVDVRSALKREQGQALVEYALILALVSLVAAVGLGALGDSIIAQLQEAVDALA
jgi:Flp pilus assembly pilin Flp